MIDYTFVVTTYNQEKLIVQTLESIKFQIETYSKDYSIQLIIADDCSTDNATKVIDLWLENNRELFADVEKLYSPENRGTCTNYCGAIKLIKGRHFREIAGDDILPQNNIFVIMDMTDEYDVVLSSTLTFSSGKIGFDKGFYRIVLKQHIYSKRQLNILTKVACPIANGAVWKKKLMTDEVLNYISRYKLVEDRPQWYKIFEDNKYLKIGYSESPTLLSRRSNVSVTGIKSKFRSIHDQDICKIYQDIEEQTDSKLVKFFLYCNRNMKRCTPVGIWIKLITLLNYAKLKKIYKNLMDTHVEKNQKHLDYIVKISDEFMKDNGLDEQEENAG